MENRTMAGFRKKINEDTTFVHDREDRAKDAIEKIFILCCSRDCSKLEKMDQTKVGELSWTSLSSTAKTLLKVEPNLDSSLSWIRGHWPRIFLIQLELRQIVAGAI